MKANLKYWIPIVGEILALQVHLSENWKSGIIHKHPCLHGFYQGFTSVAVLCYVIKWLAF